MPDSFVEVWEQQAPDQPLQLHRKTTTGHRILHLHSMTNSVTRDLQEVCISLVTENDKVSLHPLAIVFHSSSNFIIGCKLGNQYRQQLRYTMSVANLNKKLRPDCLAKNIPALKCTKWMPNISYLEILTTTRRWHEINVADQTSRVSIVGDIKRNRSVKWNITRQTSNSTQLNWS